MALELLSLCRPSLCWDPCPVITEATASLVQQRPEGVPWRPMASSRAHPQELGGHSSRSGDTQEATSACSRCLSPSDHHTQAEVFFPSEFLDEESFFHEILLFSLKCFIPFFNSWMKNLAQGQGQ